MRRPITKLWLILLLATVLLGWAGAGRVARGASSPQAIQAPVLKWQRGRLLLFLVRDRLVRLSGRGRPGW